MTSLFIDIFSLTAPPPSSSAALLLEAPVAERRKNRSHSTLDTLPAEVLAAIEARLHEGETYQTITDHLNRLGHDVSRAAVARWGKKVSERQAHLSAAADLARVLSDQLGANELEQAATLLALELVVDALMQHESITADMLDLPEVTRLISALARVSSVNLAKEKFKVDIERRTAEAAAAVGQQVKSAGLSDATVEAIRARILGISADVG